jgi:hypothetical protein
VVVGGAFKYIVRTSDIMARRDLPASCSLRHLTNSLAIHGQHRCTVWVAPFDTCHVAPTVVRPFFDFKNLPAPATIQISHLELDPILHRQGMVEDSPELATSAKKSSKWWLVAGSLLLGASHMRWGIGVLAWITPIPFLVYVRGTRGIAPRALVGLALFIGYTLAILKICTAPIPPVAAVPQPQQDSPEQSFERIICAAILIQRTICAAP